MNKLFHLQQLFLSGLLSILFALPTPLLAATHIEVTGLRVENMTDPLGLDTDRPRFSWQIQSQGKNAGRNVVQTHYHIIVCSTYEKFNRNEGDLWDSGDVASAEQLWIPYAGKPLKSNQHAYWKVRIKTNKGSSEWSTPPHRFSTGLLSEAQWHGRWIGLERMMPGEQTGQHSRLAARYLRKEFQLQAKAVRRATAFIAGLGLYRLYINGNCVRKSSEVMTPLPSDYRKTIYYNTYDVTPILSAAADLNRKFAVGIVLGNGRYFAMRQNKPYKNVTFGLPKCRLNIIIEYEDGKTECVQTDETWRLTTEGPIRANNEYDGEEYDARMELGAWTLPGYDDGAWMQAERSAIPTGTLRGQMAPSMTEGKTIPPVSRKNDIVDFGQNMAGWVTFTPQGRPGDTIRIRYAERLNDDGTLYTDNLRDAKSEDVYICGNTKAAWHPAFVTHGFRYVEVKGPATAIAACTVNDEMEQTGDFACSDSILNKVVRNARHGIASNYKGMPVDCPQRNERQPWLGDRTVGSL